jgi:hypothetical protein
LLDQKFGYGKRAFVFRMKMANSLKWKKIILSVAVADSAFVSLDQNQTFRVQLQLCYLQQKNKKAPLARCFFLFFSLSVPSKGTREEYHLIGGDGEDTALGVGGALGAVGEFYLAIARLDIGHKGDVASHDSKLALCTTYTKVDNLARKDVAVRGGNLEKITLHRAPFFAFSTASSMVPT